MRKLVLGLTASTLAFAGSTIYLWLELAAERAHRARPAAMTNIPAPVAVQSSAVRAVPVPTAAKPAEPGPARETRTKEQTTAQGYTDLRKQMAAAAPAFFASLADSQERAEMLAANKAAMRSYSPGLQRYLGLSDEAFDRFLDVLAELELTGREAASRCALDSDCRFPNWDRASVEARRRNALLQFGTDVAEKYDFYRRSANERQVVAEFRGRLDDATRLTDAQSDKLVRALLEEHERIREALEKTPGNIGAVNGVAYAEMDFGARDDSGADRTEEIAGYNRRLRDGAASVLTAAQLAVFDQMQAEAIADSRSRNRRSRGNNAGSPN